MGTETWKPLCSLESEQRGYIAFSPDGLTLASCNGNEAYFWDVQNWMRKRTLIGHREGIACLVFSPDGKKFATGGVDATAILWNAQTGEFLHRFSGFTNWVESVAFSPDSKILAVGCGGGLPMQTRCEIKLYDSTEMILLQTIAGIGTSVNVLQFSKDGKLLIAGGGNVTSSGYLSSSFRSGGWVKLWRKE